MTLKIVLKKEIYRLPEAHIMGYELTQRMKPLPFSYILSFFVSGHTAKKVNKCRIPVLFVKNGI